MSTEKQEQEQPDRSEVQPDRPPTQAGFIKFYGLYWRKGAVSWSETKLMGRPSGWSGSGRFKSGGDPASAQMNFWKQKGVYVLYDSRLQPVYAGQAGLTRNSNAAGRSIGDRLREHSQGIYRNGWELFSWFGFLSTEKLDLRNSNEATRLQPDWKFQTDASSELNLLLASFEAVLIEGFAPRFNARGGDLKGAVLVDQFDPTS